MFSSILPYWNYVSAFGFIFNRNLPFCLRKREGRFWSFGKFDKWHILSVEETRGRRIFLLLPRLTTCCSLYFCHARDLNLKLVKYFSLAWCFGLLYLFPRNLSTSRLSMRFLCRGVNFDKLDAYSLLMKEILIRDTRKINSMRYFYFAMRFYGQNTFFFSKHFIAFENTEYIVDI